MRPTKKKKITVISLQRVLCSDLHPAVPAQSSPRSPSIATAIARLYQSTEPRVHLSWAPIFHALGLCPEDITSTWMNMAVVETFTNTSDTLYRLYQDCLRDLRAKYSKGSWSCTAVKALCTRPLGISPASFSTLVNFLVGLLDDAVHDGLGINRTSMTLPVPAFIFSGTLFDWEWKERHLVRCHVACAVIASPWETEGLDPYLGLFLDCVKARLCHENWRRHHPGKQSLMPWSEDSKQEIAEAASMDTNTHEFKDLAEPLPEPDSPYVRVLETSLWRPALDVPWLGATHDGYPSCPTLGGYTTARRASGRIHSLRDDAALWLSALTFGLLEAATLLRIPESLFLTSKTEGGRSIQVLSGQRISQFFAYYFKESVGLPGSKGPPAEHGRRIARLLRRAFSAVSSEHTLFSSTLVHAGFRSADCDSICSALLIVVFFPLSSIAATLWPDNAELDQLNAILHQKWPSPSPTSFVIRTLQRNLRNNGWCPYVIAQLTSAFESSWNRALFQYAGSTLVHCSPYIATSAGEHQSCTDDACDLLTFTDSDYKLRHTHSSCQCERVAPGIEEVRQLLSAGNVPVVVYDGTVLQVKPADSVRYVAISHVWAEGMGSTTEEGLPRCVVERITILARKTLPGGDGALWLDSLCVSREVTLRKQAISLMGDTYRNASAVLVIDGCIRTQCSLANSFEENILWIGSSAWLRRVWTVQEGLLANRLYFEFKEGPVNFEDRVRPDSDSLASADKSRWMSIAVNALVPILAYRINKRNFGPRVGDLPAPTGESLLGVVRLLDGRTTSKTEDELIAIASLLPPSVSLHRLLAVPHTQGRGHLAEQRMQSCLVQLGHVSRGLPFGYTPRLSLPGFTWAPRSLTNRMPAQWDTSLCGTAFCTEDGLLATYSVAILRGAPTVAFPRPMTGELARWGWRIAMPLHHVPSNTSHLLFAHLRGPLSVSVDALLFLNQDFPRHLASAPGIAGARVEVECVAVTNFTKDHDTGVNYSASDDDVRCYRYVAYCKLIQWEEIHGTGDGLEMTYLDELVETPVKLL
ncbi:hypothetical protein PYCCODRAFT_1410767 [Trametes coccinea BRFM310]|uniref:Heterokaryon incompatibility domain-containing protein n=1 Tax=Trametes coccinea (strain BRFM310) TaxID=1353009 RepID=A0A1Y2IQ73_TRAC3|nr:hypothetical protein PYCCODRAFT_1410767 [Trametes coccinea BRFM310]